MRNVLKLTAAIEFFGLASGLMIVGAPQAGLALGMRDETLGLLGAAMPVGYASGCLFFGHIFRRVPGKFPLIGGVLGSLLAAFLMGHATSPSGCVAAQFLFGLANGAFWPFASAWMLDFQHDKLPKTTILRCYNVAWTSGTAAGMYAGGWLCRIDRIAESFYLAAGLLLMPVVMALLAPATRKSTFQDDLPPEARPRRVGLALLVAAVTANLLVLATRTTIVNNYAELNQFLNFEADRMGLLVASALVGQLLGFLFGSVYEPLLGRRTMYAFMAVCLILINLAVAYVVNLPLLICAMALCGLVAAIGFQTAIFAAVECFRFPRTGTSFHEAMVGLGGMGTFASGLVARHAKSAGFETADALRAPFVVLAITAAACLVLQLVLVTWRSHNRILLQASDAATRPAQS